MMADEFASFMGGFHLLIAFPCGIGLVLAARASAVYQAGKPA
jgi:hypothetical protein